MSIIPQFLAPTTQCPTWCDGGCADWHDDGSSYHAHNFGDVPADRFGRGLVDFGVSVARLDEAGTAGTPEVHVLVVGRGQAVVEDFRFTPARARQMAGELLAAALAAESDRVQATAPGLCPRCGCERLIRGRLVKSAAGVVRVRNGRCTECGKGKCFATLRTVDNQTAGARAPAASR